MSNFPHLWIPKVKIWEPKRAISMNHGLRGEFELQACNRYGHVKRRHVQPDHNLITNGGLDYYMTAQFGVRPRCVVGIGSSDPEFTDTTLGTQVGATTTILSRATQVGGGTTVPYFNEVAITYDFGLGTLDDTLREVGVGPDTGSPPHPLFAKDRIRDDGGAPTDFPIDSSEQLRVIHRLRRIIPHTPYDDDITITGSGTHDFEVIPAGVTVTNNAGWGSFENVPYIFGLSTNGSRCMETQTLLDPTSQSIPSSGATYTSAVNGTYSAGTHVNTASITWGLTLANFASGVGSAWINMFSLSQALVGCWQVSFNPRIPKFAGSVQRIMVLNFEYGIARP